jgi:hypothetical protein
VYVAFHPQILFFLLFFLWPLLCLYFKLRPLITPLVSSKLFFLKYEGLKPLEGQIKDYKMTMRAGGCTCSRCGFIGACLAARVSFHYVALLLLRTSISSAE